MTTAILIAAAWLLSGAISISLWWHIGAQSRIPLNYLFSGTVLGPLSALLFFVDLYQRSRKGNNR